MNYKIRCRREFKLGSEIRLFLFNKVLRWCTGQHTHIISNTYMALNFSKSDSWVRLPDEELDEDVSARYFLSSHFRFLTHIYSTSTHSYMNDPNLWKYFRRSITIKRESIPNYSKRSLFYSKQGLRWCIGSTAHMRKVLMICLRAICIFWSI